MKLILVLTSFLASLLAFAQQPQDTVVLKEVNIEASRSHLPLTGVSTDTLDTRLLERHSTSSVFEIIAASGKAFVKTYTPGGLSSSSLNGTNATQTNVIWNGIKIESPMLGQADGGLFPAIFTDEVIIQSGGRSDSWGSGSMGGSILLNNQPLFNAGMKAVAHGTWGSFGDQQYAARVMYGGRKYSGAVGWFNHENENEYLYKDFFGNLTKRNHAAYRIKGLTSNHYFISGAHQFSVNIWLQQANRDIPLSVTESGIPATQQDKSARAVASWKYLKGKINYELSTGLNSEQLVYEKAGADSSDFFTSSSHGAIWYQWHGSEILLGADFEYSKAHEHYYASVPEQNIPAILASWKKGFQKLKLKAAISVRQEWVDGKKSPIAPAISLEKKLPWHLELLLSASGAYRNTTFNERYWTPGGNPDLLPESGLITNATLRQLLTSGNFQWRTAVEGFDNRIKNQIVWMGGSIYTPVNVTKVHASGITASEKVTWTKSKFSCSASGTYTYTRSVNTEVASNQRTSEGKQTVYVPLHQAAGVVFVGYRKIMLSYEQSYTGYYYIQSDNLDSLPARSVSNAAISYQIPVKKLTAEFRFAVNNLFNASYYVINYYPMPLRSYQFSCILKFNSKTK